MILKQNTLRRAVLRLPRRGGVGCLDVLLNEHAVQRDLREAGVRRFLSLSVADLSLELDLVRVPHLLLETGSDEGRLDTVERATAIDRRRLPVGVEDLHLVRAFQIDAAVAPFLPGHAPPPHWCL